MGSKGQGIVIAYLTNVESSSHGSWFEDSTSSRRCICDELPTILAQLVLTENGKKDKNGEWNVSREWLWIDQSINQDDNDKRSNQVKPMTHRYSRAISALIRLGYDYGKLNLALDLISQIGELSERGRILAALILRHPRAKDTKLLAYHPSTILSGLCFGDLSLGCPRSCAVRQLSLFMDSP